MLLGIYAIYDTGVSTWRPPIFARLKGDVIRSFTEAVNNVQTEFGKHPEDYVLFQLGTWDDDKCFFDLLQSPTRLGVGVEFVKSSIDASPKA